MNRNLPRLNTLRRETSSTELDIKQVESRLNRIRSNHSSNLRTVRRIQLKMHTKQHVRRRRQSETLARVNREITRNSELYDLQEKVRLQREQSNNSRLMAYQDLEQTNAEKASLIFTLKAEHAKQRAEEFSIIHKQKCWSAMRIRQQIADISLQKAKLWDTKREISVRNYRSRLEEQLKKRDSVRHKLSTLENEEMVELEKLKDSEMIKMNAIEQFNRTVQFRRQRAHDHGTTRRRFDQF